MGTRGYGYYQIRVRIHILMGSQIPVYYTRGNPFDHPPVGFYLRIPVNIGIFVTPKLSDLFRPTKMNDSNEY